jgi:hypothetical protein
MFSNGLRVFAVGVGLVAASVLVNAQTITHGDGALGAPKAGMYSTSVASSESSRMARLMDRSQIDSMPELVDSLLDTIARMSNYRKPDFTPRVSKVARAEIERTVCSGPCPVKAYHLPEAGIFIDDSLIPETDLVHRSILLHELVHFLQDVNGEGAGLDECGRWLQREREAYWLQNQYLALIGNSSSYHMMVANQSWIAANRTTCDVWRRAVNTAQ